MFGRSLSCSPEGIQKAKKALIRYSLTQKALAQELEVTRQPIGKFFTGRPVDRNLFVQICDRLDLEWEEIVAEPASEPEVNQDNSIDIDAIVQAVREKIKPLIQERCGTMRVLDMTQPIGLNDIYTSVNILEKITGQQRLGINELLQECTNEDFDRFGLNTIATKRVPGLEAVEKYFKLMILGKPGAGKTTFLKYLAIQCIEGEFQGNRVPIFITLKDFAEAANKPGLLEYISQLFSSCKIMTTQVADLFKHGRVLLLLDGLDEIREEDSSEVIHQIREASDNFYLSEEFKKDSLKYSQEFKKDSDKYLFAGGLLKWLCKKFPQKFYTNYFVTTCRIAANEYTFEKFIEVEVADFDNDQISNFANNWFKDKAVKPETFIKRLEENNRIKQLAASPLLLTLLCLAFEESGDFPANRSELYKEGLDALLKKWDAKRGIQRDQIYKKLSVQRKEDLLSKMALITFERGDYFFKQKTAEQYIIDYIRNLPNANTDDEALQLDSERLLKSIEAQHGLLVERAKGIYSFSHLTFHEYFAAREIVFGTHSLEERLQNLVIHLNDKRWREVLFLALGMSPSADHLLLLMKKHIDGLVVTDKKLQKFLVWLKEKSISVDCPCKPSTVRAWYFDYTRSYIDLNMNNPVGISLVRALDPTFDIKFNPDFALKFNPDFALDHTLVKTLLRALDFAIFRTHQYQDGLIPDLDIENVLKRTLDPKLTQSLRKFQEQLPNKKDWQRSQQWWLANGKAWYEELREVMIKYRNIGHDWQFSNEQKELLQQYYDANKLLVDCLNSDCYVIPI
ncbi:MAG: NACHT domain-containing NTPase [Nostoc sp. DedSLP03]|uniref:NACHT domain-containing NTPase n=1 Tax=Nostoc sp. DedSLP03 TaxID=3075400 RepID=UPI002AD345AF|nr:NACHT domain-containing NTPase [Nostoc sp. DedSLP03]MDZ7969232.1 NACHT domain-containing NTPase [Nostoc sp. DedSLP03]